MVNVFITNLAKYNEGKLIGDWVSLPMDSGELEDKVNEILGDNEEYFITDYEKEFDVDIGEYTNIYKLNEQLEELDYLDEYDQNKVKAILEWGTLNDLSEIIDSLDNYNLNESITNESDLACEYIENRGIDLSDFIVNYIDLKYMGKDLAVDGYISEFGYIEGGY